MAWGGDGQRVCSARENPSRAGDERKPNPSLYASALPAYGMPRQQRRGISFLVSPPSYGEETQEQKHSPGARQRLFLPSLFAQPRWGTPAARVHNPLPGLKNAAGNWISFFCFDFPSLSFSICMYSALVEEPGSLWLLL